MNEEKHHYTLNHFEDAEVIIISKKEHDRTTGNAKTLSNEMSIRRDIMYELLKVIPLDEMNEVLEETIEECQKKMKRRIHKKVGRPKLIK